eukprot:281765-Amphidinium_carterae.1
MVRVFANLRPLVLCRHGICVFSVVVVGVYDGGMRSVLLWATEQGADIPDRYVYAKSGPADQAGLTGREWPRRTAAVCAQDGNRTKTKRKTVKQQVGEIEAHVRLELESK